MAEFLDLPNEIIADIVRYGPQSTLAALCLTSRRISAISTPFLYMTIRFRDNQSKLQSEYGQLWLPQFEHLRSFTLLMLRRPDLARYVKMISFREQINALTEVEQWKARVSSFRSSLPDPENLNDLTEQERIFEEKVASMSFKVYDPLEKEFIEAVDRFAADEETKDKWIEQISSDGNDEALVSILLPVLTHLESLDFLLPYRAAWWKKIVNKGIMHDSLIFAHLRRVVVSDFRAGSGSAFANTLTWFYIPNLREFYLHGISCRSLVKDLERKQLTPPLGRSNLEVLDIRASQLAHEDLALILSLPKRLKSFSYNDDISGIYYNVGRDISVIEKALRGHEETLEQLVLETKNISVDSKAVLRLEGFSKLKRFRCSGVLMKRDSWWLPQRSDRAVFSHDRLPQALEELVVVGVELAMTLSSVLALKSLINDGRLKKLKRMVWAGFQPDDKVTFQGLYGPLESLIDAADSVGMSMEVEVWFYKDMYRSESASHGSSVNDEDEPFPGRGWGWQGDIYWEINTATSHVSRKWSEDPFMKYKLKEAVSKRLL